MPSFASDYHRTGCEFSIAPKFLALARCRAQPRQRSGAVRKMRGHSVAEYGAGMRVIAAFFGPCAPDALPSHVPVFSHYFKRLDRFAKLATSSLLLGAFTMHKR